jgi:hypothetical protein
MEMTRAANRGWLAAREGGSLKAGGRVTERAGDTAGVAGGLLGEQPRTRLRFRGNGPRGTGPAPLVSFVPGDVAKNGNQ